MYSLIILILYVAYNCVFVQRNCVFGVTHLMKNANVDGIATLTNHKNVLW